MSRTYIIVLSVFTLVTPGLGQSLTDTEEVNKSEIWTRGQVSYSLGSSWRGATNIDYRAISNGDERWSIQSYTQDFIYLLNPAIELVGSFRLFHTNLDELTNNELRPAVGVRFDLLRAGRVTIRNYLRYEYRNFRFKDESLNASGSRYRNRLFGSVALNNPRPFQANTLLLRWGVELFAEKDQLDDQMILSRYRLEAGFGYNLNDSWAFNFFYLNQGSRLVRGSDYYIKDSILFLTAFYTIGVGKSDE